MAARRRKKRLCDIVAILFAAMLLGADLMVRDPQTAAAPNSDNAFAVCLILMSLGVLVVAYGLHQGRRQFLPLLRAQVKRRLPSVPTIEPLPLPMPD